ncbi:chromosomal replication initiator protein DnaA [Candidatus Peregrinibacteria bacterium]|nr:chromosomal replication initiator protein DnaA [Candidatus Peregrinibacteria bacterium]
MNLKDLWVSIIKKLSEELDRAQIITWFKNTAALSFEDGILVIGLPTPFYSNWHMTHFAKMTFKAAQSVEPNVKEVTYSVDNSLNDSDSRTVDILKYFPENQARKLPNKNERVTKEGVVTKIFNQKYTLDNFIIAPENRLAHAACQNVAKYPGQNYNPLFIYGGVGLGKTHLLQGTGNEIMRNDPSRFVVYTTTENFVNEVVGAIQARNMNAIRNKYRRVDCLIIDDVQFIANKDRTQEEFFHTFNALYESGKQIIISSDRPPQELKLLNERLISRFESGMTVDVKMPDYETRLAILHNKCQEAQVFINSDVLEFIAFNVTSSVRSLEGVLKRAIARYELERTSPTIKAIAEMLRETKNEVKMIGFTTQDPAPRCAVTIDSLIDSVSSYFSVPKSEVVGTSRARECMVPRQVIMYLAKTKLRMSLSKIGDLLGNRNHTTVMHSVNRINDQLKNDRQLLRDMNAITKEVGIH